MKGNADKLKALRLGMMMPVAEVLKALGKAPPLAVLKLCYGSNDYDFADYVLQHADDLDFIQDTLSATCSSLQLNPILNGVLAGFNRRRRYGRFKWGHRTLEFDRLRFAQTASEKDSDLFATELVESKTNKNSGRKNGGNSWGAICKFYQKAAGCFRQSCIYAHRCIICNKRKHGAVNCMTLRRASERGERSREERKSEERPPNPRKRRARAQ